MLKLPKISRAIGRTEREAVQVQGINYTDNYTPGSLAFSKNLTAAYYPTLATRNDREQKISIAATALAAWDKLIYVYAGGLYYGETVLGTLRVGVDAERQFAVVNTKLIIWPDKQYVDMSDTSDPTALHLENMEVTAGPGGSVQFGTHQIAAPFGDFTEMFKAGDKVRVSGCVTYPANNRVFTVASVPHRNTLETVEEVDVDGTAAHELSDHVTVARVVPDLDYICESENRLWGCCNADRTIYASALGDPCDFWSYTGVSTDSYAVAVGSKGEFTGCASLGSSVLFFKERALHKVMGSYPAEYAMYTYDLDGVKAGCDRSMVVINDVLYYLSPHGVMSYTGGSATHVSAELGERPFADAAAGSDGLRYYLSCRTGDEWQMLTYDLASGRWLREDDTHAVHFARLGNDLYYMTADGAVWLADTGEREADIAWEAITKPFFETVEGRKRYSKILLRAQVAAGGWLQAEVRCDGKRWMPAGRITGERFDTQMMAIVPNRCDRFEIRLTGVGHCKIHNILRQFYVGSDARW